MESKVPASEISNHKLYSELEEVLLDIKSIVDNNKKIEEYIDYYLKETSLKTIL
jgi:uncharacterized protein YjfI (DUF2170 family)